MNVTNFDLDELLELDDPVALDKIDDRTIFILGEINDNLYNQAIIPIMKLNQKEKNLKAHEPIRIYISSEGGALHHAFALMDVIRSSDIPVHIYGMGLVASAAFMILSAGHKRYGYRNTSFLFHEGSWGISQDKMSVLKSNMKEVNNVEERMIRHLEKYTCMTESQIRDNAAREWWMDSQEALKLKVIDEII